jgi:hypothetical protein
MWNKGCRRQAAAIPEKEEGNRDRHRRAELKTTDLQDPQEDLGAGIREASKRDVQRVLENEEMDPVERSAPSETKKEIVHGVRAGNVGGPPFGTVSPHQKEWMMTRT